MSHPVILLVEVVECDRFAAVNNLGLYWLVVTQAPPARS